MCSEGAISSLKRPRAQLSGQLTQAFLLRWSLSPLVGYNGPA